MSISYVDFLNHESFKNCIKSIRDSSRGILLDSSQLQEKIDRLNGAREFAEAQIKDDEDRLSLWSRFWLEVKRGLGWAADPRLELTKAHLLLSELRNKVAMSPEELRERELVEKEEIIVENIQKGVKKIAVRTGQHLYGLSKAGMHKIAKHIVRTLKPNPQRKWHKSSEISGNPLERSIYQHNDKCALLIGKYYRRGDPLVVEDGGSVKVPKYYIDTDTGEARVYSTMGYTAENEIRFDESEAGVAGLVEFGNQENMVEWDFIADVRRGKRRGCLKRTIFMPLYEGPDLLGKIVAIRKLPRKERLNLLLAMAKSINTMHKKGWIHRDIKPANYFCGADCTKPKLADFGYSQRWSSGFCGLKGTFEYMAPEVAAKRPDADYFKSDVWSLGASFLCLLASVPREPYLYVFDQDEIDVFCEEGLKKYPPFEGYLILSMLQKDQKARPKMQDVVSALEKEIATL